MENPQQKNSLVGIFPTLSAFCWFFAGAAAKTAAANRQVTIIITTTPTPNQRKKFSHAAKTIGLETVYFLKHQSGMFKKDGFDNLKMEIFDILNEEKPASIISFQKSFFNDPDWKITADAAEKAVEKYVEARKPLIENYQYQYKFYCLSMPNNSLTFWQKKGFFGKSKEGFYYTGEPDKKFTTIIDWREFKDKIASALEQMLPDQEIQIGLFFHSNFKNFQDYCILKTINNEPFLLEENSSLQNEL